MASLQGMTCFCCGADITAPQFYKGKAYGWSCVLKVNPSAKRIKDAGLWVKFDSVETSGVNTVVSFLGLRFIVGLNSNNVSIENRMFKIALNKNGKRVLYKAIRIDSNFDPYNPKRPLVLTVRTSKASLTI